MIASMQDAMEEMEQKEDLGTLRESPPPPQTDEKFAERTLVSFPQRLDFVNVTGFPKPGCVISPGRDTYFSEDYHEKVEFLSSEFQ